MISLKDIELAQKRIAPYIKKTSVILNESLSQYCNTNIYLKLEIFQKTGSFKVRGVFNKMLNLTPEERAHGVVAVSAGNHAQAVALAGRVMRLKSMVLMPESTSRNSIEATRAYGAEVLLTNSLSEAFERVHEYVKHGWTYIHPFDDPFVVAGQGTMGLEILEDLPNVTDIFVSIGGGSMAGGIAVAIKSHHSRTRIWGVETKGADVMAQSLMVGHLIQLMGSNSIAKTLAVPKVSDLTFTLAQKYLQKVIVVSDLDTVRWLQFLLERLKILTEPAASCTLAALETMKHQFKPTDHVVVVLSGGNVSLEELCQYRQQFKL